MLKGWRIVGATGLAVSLMVAGLLLVHGTGEEGWRVVVRATARSSVVLFLAAFSASALNHLWPHPLTRSLLLNRRYVGVSFGVSHGLHALTLAGLFGLLGEAPDTFTLVVGFGAYLLIAGMVATSFDRSAAWLGPKRWSALHRTGLYYVWVVFTFDYLGLMTRDPFSAAVAAALFGSMGLRLWSHRRSA